MIPFMIMFAVFILLTIYMILLYFSDLVTLIINAIIMWVVWMRAFHDVTEKRILKPYYIGLIITTILFASLREYILVPYLLWPVWFIALTFIIAQLILLEKDLDKKYNYRAKILKK